MVMHTANARVEASTTWPLIMCAMETAVTNLPDRGAMGPAVMWGFGMPMRHQEPVHYGNALQLAFVGGTDDYPASAWASKM